MSAGVFIACVGSMEVYRGDDLMLAQTYCVLKTPEAARQSLHTVRHEPSGDQWIGRLGEDRNWHWTKVNANRPAARQRFADAAVKEDLGLRNSAAPRAGAAPTKHRAPARTPAFTARLPYKED